MTEIVERRLKCDYCDNVSPVLEGDERPKGWVAVPLHSSPVVVNGVNALTLEQDQHFCTEDHYLRSGLPQAVALSTLKGW